MAVLLNYIKNNKWAQFALVAIISMSIGYYLMPSKTIETINEIENQSDKKLIAELQSTINTQIKQLEKLKKQITDNTVVTQYPDGTIVTQYNVVTNIDSTTDTNTQIIAEYKSKIDELTKEINYLKEYSKTEINKRFGTLNMFGSYNKDIKAVSGLLQIDAVNRFGVVAGGGYDWNSKAAIIHGGLSFKL